MPCPLILEAYGMRFQQKTSLSFAKSYFKLFFNMTRIHCKMLQTNKLNATEKIGENPAGEPSNTSLFRQHSPPENKVAAPARFHSAKQHKTSMISAATQN